jgi:hypothetical protein
MFYRKLEIAKTDQDYNGLLKWQPNTIGQLHKLIIPVHRDKSHWYARPVMIVAVSHESVVGVSLW